MRLCLDLISRLVQQSATGQSGLALSVQNHKACYPLYISRVTWQRDPGLACSPEPCRQQQGDRTKSKLPKDKT